MFGKTFCVQQSQITILFDRNFELEHFCPRNHVAENIKLEDKLFLATIILHSPIPNSLT